VTVNHSHKVDSDLASQEDSEQEQEQEPGEDNEEQDAEQEDAEQKDAEEEDGEDADALSLRRSARLRTRNANPAPSSEPTQAGGGAIKSKPLRTRQNPPEEAIGNTGNASNSRLLWPRVNLLEEAVSV
jgi:hypothetical protein